MVVLGEDEVFKLDLGGLEGPQKHVENALAVLGDQQQFTVEGGGVRGSEQVLEDDVLNEVDFLREGTDLGVRNYG